MKPELNENDQFIYSWQENLMIFSRQDECEHLIRAKFNGLVK